MADRHLDDGPGSNRRTFLKTVGLVGVASLGGLSASSGTAVAVASYDSSRPGDSFVDLGAQGLTGGDDLTPYVEDHFESDAQVYIPPGTYDFDADVLSGTYSNCALIGDAAGVEFQRPSDTVRPSIRASSGEVLFENMTLSGVKGELQSRWRCDPQGGDIRLRNVNWPDGTVSPSDSQCVYSEGSSGTIYFENCYFGPHGNSLAYATYGNADVVIDGCTFMNSNSSVRPSPRGLTMRNTIWFADDLVPEFSQDGGPAEGAWARCVKNEHSDATVRIENCHVIVTDACSDPGPFIDNQEGADGSVDGLYIYNETDQVQVRGVDHWSASNVHVSGRGDTSVPWSVSGSEMPDRTKEVWTPDDSSPQSGGSTTDSGSQPATDTVRFEIQSTADSGPVTYEFTADGDISQADGDVEDNDSVSDNGDGTWTATGLTGNGFTDVWDVGGDVQDFATSDADAVTLLFDGVDVTDDLLGGDENDPGGQHRFEIQSAPEYGELTYEFTADGPVAQAEGDVENNDSDTDNGDGTWTATGATGNGYSDLWDVSGSIVDVSVSDEDAVTLLFDGSDVTDDLLGDGGGDGSDGGDGGDGSDDGDGSTEPPSGVVVIDGSAEPDTTARYTFSVTGTVEYDPDRSSTVDDGIEWDRMQDVVGDSSATGVVGNGVDAFQVTGELVAIDVRGAANYTIEWESR